MLANTRVVEFMKCWFDYYLVLTSTCVAHTHSIIKGHVSNNPPISHHYISITNNACGDYELNYEA